ARADVMPDGRPVAWFETKNRHTNRPSSDYFGHVVTSAPAGGGAMTETPFVGDPADSVTVSTWLERTFALDRGTGAHRARMYRAAEETRHAAVSMVVYHSDDEGRHWVRATVAELGDTVSVMRFYVFPTLTVTPQGVVGVMWYANPHDRCVVLSVSRD